MKLKLSWHSLELLQAIISPWIEDLIGINDAKELIWRYLLSEVNKLISISMIEIRDEIEVKFRPYQILALYELFERLDLTDFEWDDYQLHLFMKLESKIVVPINAGRLP